MSALEGSFALLADAAAGLRDVSDFRAFGCRCLRAGGKIFALAQPEGRIALKVPVSAAELLAVPGARRFTPGRSKTFGAWVLAPEAFHDDPDALAAWTRRAYDEVLAAPPAPASRKAGSRSAKARSLAQKPEGKRRGR